MNIAISTAATNDFLVLAPYFIRSVRNYEPTLDIFLFVGEGEERKATTYLRQAKCGERVNCIGLPDISGLPNDDATQACASKLSIWKYLPRSVTHTIFLDIDTVMIGPLVSNLLECLDTTGMMIAARDAYVGFKENMESEFDVLGRAWKPKFDLEGKRKYVNTGLLASSRIHHEFLSEVLQEWIRFYQIADKNPSIWDQNIFNYCLDIGEFSMNWNDVLILGEHYNALKEYEIFVDLDLSMVSLAGKQTRLLHFNGGDLLTKFARRAKSIQVLGCFDV